MPRSEYIWTICKFETKYEESGTRIKFGNTWEFTAAPTAPPRKIFTLHYEGMRYYVSHYDSSGDVFFSSEHPELNIGLLEQFYQEHEMWKSFDLQHPVYNSKVCRFNKPLHIPKGYTAGRGMVEPFSVELIEVP